MCKVFIMAGITPETNSKAVALVKAIAGPMSVANKDGMGYTALAYDGSMFGQRWINNDSAFKPPPVIPDTSEMDSLIATYGEAVEYNKPSVETAYGEHNSFGVVDLSSMAAITLHARMATSSKGFKNTHPFVENDTSVIHNGVIRNVGDFDLKLSTCDSESILIAYQQQGVASDPTNAQGMADMLTGYYACGVFSRDASGARTMDIFKANGARLSGTFIKELGVFVYSTSEYDIKEAAVKAGLTCGPTFTFKDEWLTRLDYTTGKVVVSVPFKQANEYHVPAKVTNPLPTNHSPVRHLPKKKSLSKNMEEFLKLKPMTRTLSYVEMRDLGELLTMEA